MITTLHLLYSAPSRFYGIHSLFGFWTNNYHSLRITSQTILAVTEDIYPYLYNLCSRADGNSCGGGVARSARDRTSDFH